MTGELFRTAAPGTGTWLQAPSSALNGGIRTWDYEVVKGTAKDKLITGGEETFDVLIVALMLEKGALYFYTKAQGWSKS